MPPKWWLEEQHLNNPETHNKQAAELPCWDPTCTAISCSSCHQLLITSKQNHFRADSEIFLIVMAFPVLRHLRFDLKASTQVKKKPIHNNLKKQSFLFTFFQWLSKADAKIPSFFQMGLELTFFLPQGYGKTEKRHIWLMSGNVHDSNTSLDPGGFSCRESYNNHSSSGHYFC